VTRKSRSTTKPTKKTPKDSSTKARHTPLDHA
jgi:hypothetical protein